MALEIPQAEADDFWLGRRHPSWRGVRSEDGRRSANVACGNGHTAGLSAHVIAADGTVSPSLVCPVAGCGWHEVVRLTGWEA